MSKIHMQFVASYDEPHTFLEISYEDFTCEVVNRNGQLFCLVYEDNKIHQVPLLPFLDALSRGKEELSE